jgi:hypothetical protein
MEALKMDFKGSAIRLQPGELGELTATYQLTEAHCRTVIDVETSGKGFNVAGWPEFLFEPHVFYKNCPKDKLAEAIKQGLAYPQWRGPGSYPKTLQLRIQQFQKAADLDETAAIKSASWGLGQIMGSECVEAGYESPQAMIEGFKDSEANQVKGMLALIKHRHLDKDLHDFPDMSACEHFALIYNGKAYRKNNYHIKLHDAYIRWAGRQAVHQDTEPAPDGTIRYGDRDEDPKQGPVRALQEALKHAGYSLMIDGQFGNGTRTTILAWKANEGMDTSSPDMTLADQEMLRQASPMPVAAARANTTAADLKPTSTIVQSSSLGKKILGWATGLTTVATGAQQTGILDTAQSAVDKANQAKGIVVSTRELVVESGAASLLQLVYEWRFPAMIVVAVVAFAYFHFIQKKRVEMHQKAEIA